MRRQRITIDRNIMKFLILFPIRFLGVLIKEILLSLQNVRSCF